MGLHGITWDYTGLQSRVSIQINNHTKTLGHLPQNQGLKETVGSR